MKFTLRYYQKAASDAAVSFMLNKKTKGGGVLILPTGAGKSLCVADIASRLDSPLLVFQPNKEIVEQNYDKMLSYGEKDCGIFSASVGRKEIRRVTFATIGSVKACPEKFDHFMYVLIDECHLVNPTGGLYKDFLSRVQGRKIVGLTATPYRLTAQQGISVNGKFMPNGTFDMEDYMLDGVRLLPNCTFEHKCMLKFITRTRPRLFEKVLYSIDSAALLKEGYLAKLRYFDLTQMDTANVKRNSTGMDYDEDSLRGEYAKSGLMAQLLDVVNRLLHPKTGVPRKGILVFTQFIEESEYLCSRIEGAEIVTGSTTKKERKRIIKGFKSGEIHVVSNVGVLTTGFDYPELDTIVIAKPTMSLALYYQIVGRCIRPYEGKDGWIIDLGGNLRRFGRVETLKYNENGGVPYISNSDGQRDIQLTNVYF